MLSSDPGGRRAGRVLADTLRTALVGTVCGSSDRGGAGGLLSNPPPRKPSPHGNASPHPASGPEGSGWDASTFHAACFKSGFTLQNGPWKIKATEL